MADKYFNPFQSLEINVPVELHEAFSRYCQTGGKAAIDQSPFPRMIDLWYVSVCVAARLGLPPEDISKRQTRKIIEGQIFSQDPARIHTLMLVAIGITGDPQVVADPRKVLHIANGLAVAGLPRVTEMLREGDAEPIWNLSDGLDALLRNRS